MKPLLLFVGENPSTTDVLNHIFSNRYRTVTCTTTDEALTYFASAPDTDRPVAALCDQATPEDTTPSDVFRALKNDHRLESIPLVVLLADQEPYTPLYDLGWNEVIRKPFNPDGVALAVRNIASAHL